MDSIYPYSTLKPLTNEVSDTETLGPGLHMEVLFSPPIGFCGVAAQTALLGWVNVIVVCFCMAV